MFHSNKEMIDIFWKKEEIRKYLKEQDIECFNDINIEKTREKVFEF